MLLSEDFFSLLKIRDYRLLALFSLINYYRRRISSLNLACNSPVTRLSEAPFHFNRTLDMKLTIRWWKIVISLLDCSKAWAL